MIAYYNILNQFIAVERHVDQLVEKIPGFSAYCKQFGKHAQDISSKWMWQSHMIIMWSWFLILDVS